MLLGDAHLDGRPRRAHGSGPKQAMCLANPRRDVAPCSTVARSCRRSPWHAGAVTVHRRDVLGALGVASASTLLWALGCGPHVPTIRRAPQVSGEVRTWLHDAVARLAS